MDAVRQTAAERRAELVGIRLARCVVEAEECFQDAIADNDPSACRLLEAFYADLGSLRIDDLSRVVAFLNTHYPDDIEGMSTESRQVCARAFAEALQD